MPESGERIWRYVVAVDAGTAPCVDHGMLSLCVCKPLIRRNARAGDWVIGWVPKRPDGNFIVWVGQIDEIQTIGDYCERYPERRDAIYRRIGYEPDGTEILRHTGSDLHNNPKSQRTDCRGRNALLFRKFWYWGADARPGSELDDMAYHYIGQTSRPIGDNDLVRLHDWLGQQGHPGVLGAPRTPRPSALHSSVRDSKPQQPLRCDRGTK